MGDIMIEVKDLTKDYGSRRAINKLNFTISKGEVVGFLGPNGAGKSTTMKIITGFMAPSSGTATIAGFDVFESPLEVKKRIGYLPETPPVYTDMYVRDYLTYVAELKQVPREKIKAQVNRALEKTNLTGVEKRLIHNLSKGYRQRVGIAQALVSNPEVLILDEPTVGLDPKQVAEIRELIKELRGQHTIILSTHILSEVQAICDRVMIIHQGQIVAQDRIENLAVQDRGQRRLTIRLRKEVTDLKKVLMGIEGVVNVTAGGSRCEWEVSIRGDESVVDAISSRVVGEGLGLLELSPHKVDLEDVFLKLTYGSEQAEVQS
jgi:ABC-2 type transport system ATP-binding protein